MSDMREINADILQRFLILLILFLFFNASLIKKCEALKIKNFFFFYFFKFYVLMQSMTMKHDAIYLNSCTEALCVS